MPLHLILGPMKSGKTQELISKAAPYHFTNDEVGYYQPTKNSRDAQISSRDGQRAKSHKVESLREIKRPPKIIAVDEIHMFHVSDIHVIKDWLGQDLEVYLSGLDLDYRGRLIPIVGKLLELKPDSITFKKAVCDKCHQFQAVYSQILNQSQPITEGLDIIVPDDGQYDYQARCRKCFVSSKVPTSQ